jgi:tyrocidine synthetase-3
MKRLDKNNIEDILALTAMQEGMLFHYLKDPESDSYFEQLSLEISGKIDVEFFGKALNFVIETNEMLRTVFRWEKIEHPIQIILKEHKCIVNFYDLSGKGSGRKKAALEEIKAKDRSKGFDLTQVPFRVTLCKIEEKKYEVVISNHHILYDGWSTGIILKEFFKAYHELCAGNPLIKPQAKPSIKEFIKRIQKNDILRQEEFWKDYLKDYETGTGIPVNAQRRKTKKIKQTSCCRFKFPGEMNQQIKAFVKIHKLTLFSLLCSAWGLLLQKYNATEDIVYDTTVSGRSAKLKGIENIVGLFINTRPMRVNTFATEKIAGFLSRMYASLQKREEFENSSLVNIKEYLEANSPDTLFDSVVIIENYPLDKQMMQGNENKPGKLSLNWFSIFEITNYDLTVVITAFDDIEARITYNTDIFDEDLVFKICGHFVDIVKIFIGNPSGDVSDIHIPVKEERARLLNRLKKSQRTDGEEAADQYTAPRDEIEERLAEVWSSVLKVEKSSIGIDANFFDFGGHSLKASVLIAKIHKEFNVKVPLAQAFKHPTLEKLADYIKSKLEKIREDGYLSIASAEKSEYYDLSPAQKHFYILQQIHPGRDLLNMPAVITFGGDIDKEMLDKTFQQLIKRHESLRTSFIMIDNKPVQRVHDDVEFEVQYYDAAQVEVEKIHHFIRPFDLSKAPLMRIRIISIPGRENILVIDIHHIVSDGASQQVLARDFTALILGEELPPLRLQYKDFCRWQEHSFRTGGMKEHEEYWLNRLGGILPKLNLPTDYPRPSVPAYTGHTIRVTLPVELTRDLYASIRSTGTTLYIILLAAFNILLYKYTGQTDIIIGSPTARRDHVDIENVIGLVMGGVMMRNLLHEERTILEFLGEVKGSTLEAFAHQEYPYEKLVKKLVHQDDSMVNFISPVRLNVQNMFDPRSLGKYRLQPLEQFSYAPDTSKLDLTITALGWGERGDAEMEGITLEFEYSTELFKPETIEKISGRFQQVLQEIVKNPHLQLWEIDMFPSSEKQALIGSAPRCLPLSHAQKRIYYTEKTYPGTGCNTLAFSVRYGEILDKELLEAAIHTVIGQHEGLRLRILEFESTFEPYQYIAPDENEPLDSIEFIGTNRGEDILELLNRKTLEPFTFFNSGLFYFAYIRFNRQESGFYIKIHHIISDGWTIKLLIEEIDTLYRQLRAEQPREHAPGPSYIQYIRDEKTYLHSRQAQEDREFWHRTLLPIPEADTLLFKERNLMDIRGGVEFLTFPTGLRNRMHLYCKEHKTTLFKLIFAGLSIYMARAAGNGDIAVGSAGHNRSTPLHKQTVGMFVSTIPFRVQVEEELSFADFIKKIGRDINHIVGNHQKYPFDLLIDEIKGAYRQDLHKLLDVNLVGHGDIRAERFKIRLHFPGYESSPIAIHINFNNLEIHGILQLEYYYQRALFSPADIRDMHRGIVNILDDALEYPGKKIDQVEWITDKEKQRILFRFNDTEKPYPLDKTFPGRFREQVEKRPDNIALRGVDPKFAAGNAMQIQNSNGKDSEHHLTYRELDKKSHRLAGALRSKGVERNTIVVIMMRPSVEMIIGLLGILKAGGAYLPVEPGYPEDRIEYMIKDSGAKILLSGDSSYLSESVGSVLPRFLSSHPSDPAYVIYTSGSTGRPKGVLVEHGNLMAYLTAFENQFTLTPDDTVIQQASFAFDAFVEELYPILSKGGVLAIPGHDRVRDIARLVKFMIRHCVTFITASPLLLNELNKVVAAGVIGLRIRIYISGGDVLNTGYIDELLKTGEVYNTYGPTESTVCAAYYKCQEEVPFNVPIGKPIANYKLYILDKKKRLLPVGMGGELWVSGPGVTRGYLNNPGLTEEKFKRAVISHWSLRISSSPHYPITLSHHHPIYKTGDLSRWLADGNIQFLGRIDTQVKIRGFRIELGEIEHRLLQYPGIKEVAVIAREDRTGEKYLCAYIAGEGDIRIPGVQEHLSGKLPHYMIPSYFVQLDKIPLTAAGKVDRRALPEPTIKKGDNYIAPRDEVERKLAKIWADVLQIDEDLIGSDANFFQLGGHSLKAIILISRINKVFHINLPLKKIFTTPTIKGVSEYIKSKEEKPYASIEPVEKKDYYVLSSTQKRLYILHQMDESSTSYNMPYALRLEGDVNKNKLEEIFLRLISRHLSLRTSFRMLAGVPVQRICDEVGFEIEYKEVEVEEEPSTVLEGTRGLAPLSIPAVRNSQPAAALISSFIRPFDLSKAPLLRMGLLKLEKEKYFFMVDMHHIISDGISRQLLVKEFMLATGKDLPALRLQYKDFSEWQNREAQRDALNKQKTYWKKQLGGEIPVLDLPCDYVRPTIQRFEGSAVKFTLGHEYLKKLQSLALSQGVTLFMILLGIYYILLSKLSNQEDILVGTPTGGRRHADLEQIIGMFVNTLALRNYPSGEQTYREFLTEIKVRSLEAFENQDYPYEELVEEIAITRDASRNPLFDTMFVMQNMEIPRIEVPGLKLTPDEHQIETSKFDLTLRGMEVEEELQLIFEYSTNLFKKAAIERFATYLKKIVSLVVDNEDVKIRDVEIMSQEEKKELLYDFNNTVVKYPKDKTVPWLFEEQVEQTPDHIALVVQEQGYLSYRELNERANRLARLLRREGVRRETITGIMMTPSPEMLIGILALLKAGGAYLPIDPKQQPGRVAYMLKDSAALLMLIQGHMDHVPGLGVPMLTVDRVDLIKGEGNNLERKSRPGDVVYTIYTSGTTGKSKGTLIENKNLVNYVCWFREKVHLTGKDRAILTSSFSFDLGYTAIYPSILTGCQLHIIPRETFLAPQELIGYIDRHGITYLKVTPSLFTTIVENSRFSQTVCHGLRLVVLGGEEIKLKDVEKAHCVAGQLHFMNHYGPTEATIGCVAQFIDFNRFDDYKKRPTIGTPIDNMKAFILDNGLMMVPVGVPGELCVAGANVARGYLNQPELSAQKFLHISHAIFRSYRSYMSYIYKTGDMARWTSWGAVEFLGRIDTQIKIRGYRIELEEVENRLLTHEAINEAVVISREHPSADKYLCAYYVSNNPGSLKISELKEYLAVELPDYMIPTFFVELEGIPLTPNGKLNRKLLPEPEMGALTTHYAAPGDPVEKKLVEVWQEVLEVNRIGIDDHFFQLGGHSLRAIILISRMNKVFQVNVPLAEIFRTPTIRRLAAYIKAKRGGLFTPIEPVEEKEYYALPSAQMRLYILHQMDEDNTSYNMPYVLRLEGEINKNKLEEIFIRLTGRHDSLRTSFRMLDSVPVKRIHDSVEFEIEYREVEVKVEEEPSTVLEGTKGLAPLSIPAVRNWQPAAALISSFIRPFDLSRAPLLRVGLVKESDQKHILMVDMHHIISDGISRRLLVKEFMALAAGKDLPPLRLQYKDFSDWQHREAQRETLIKQKAYWKKQLRGEIPVLNLPIDYARPTIQRFEGSTVTFSIDQEEVKSLRSLALAEGMTLYMILFGIYYILLSKLSNQEDILVGTPTVGRRHADLEQIIGMFVNTLVLRNYPTGDKTYREFLTEIKKRSLEAFENQDYPYEELVEVVAITRDASRNPLFDTMFVLENQGIPQLEIPGLKLSPHEHQTRTSKFDLTLIGVELEEKLRFIFEYSTILFRASTIERFITYFRKIVSIVVEDPGVKIGEVDILAVEEKMQLLVDFNNTRADYPGHKTMPQLFAEQVDKTPDRMALIEMEAPPPKSRTYHMTYRELNQRADQLAGKLLHKGVGPDIITGLMVDRSIHMIIGLYGILKAGGAYMPLAPDYPRERIRYMLQDSGSRLLLTMEKYTANIVFGGEVVNIEDESLFQYQESANPGKVSSPNNLIYVIYTSGSTGRPKGVPIKTRGFVNLVNWYVREFELDADDGYLLIAPISFDLAQKNLFAPLITGGCLYLAPPGLPDYDGLSEFIDLERQTVINCAPTVFYPFVEWNEHEEFKKLRWLRYVFLGGEPIHMDKLVSWLDAEACGCEIVNTYGPTECSDVVSYYRIPGKGKKKEAVGSIPIGKPIDNVALYILGGEMKLLPMGLTGEVCIGGIGLSWGYLNNPELTREKFNHDKKAKSFCGGFKGAVFSKSAPLAAGGKRVYKTGDLGRWLPGGNIEFLGRIDHQIKIRGFRIELEEIETKLRKRDQIKEAVVLAEEDKNGEKYLCAFLVLRKELAITELRGYLAQRLPDFMIPSYFLVLDEIPLTPSGKIDRRALPKPDLEAAAGYIAPRNQVEEKLAELWSEVLEVEKNAIGIDTNFFQLGGHSLKAIRLLSKIHKTFNIKLELAEVLKTPTIKEIAGFIKRLDKNMHISLQPAEEKDSYALSSAQKRLYVMQQMDEKGRGTGYNIPFAVTLEGDVDQCQLENTFTRLIKRHESLRTSFQLLKNEPVQKVHEYDELEFAVEYCEIGDRQRLTGNIEEIKPENMITDFISPFDLSRAPLLRVGLVKLEKKKYLLLVDMHHIISDGTSMAIFINDFMTLFAGREIPALTLKYRDYSEWQRQEKAKGALRPQEEFWLAQFQGDIPGIDLPTDYPRPAVQGFEGHTISFAVGATETALIKEFVARQNTTLFMLLLTVTYIFLSKVSRQEDIIIGTPTAGRHQPELEPIIGMFVNTLALRHFPDGEKTFETFLEGVTEQSWKAFENQVYQFEDLVEWVAPGRDMSRNPLFDVMFVLQNMEMPEIDIPGLRVTREVGEHFTSKFDMTLFCEEKEPLVFKLEYSTALFKPGTIKRFIRYFRQIISGVLQDPHQKIADIEMIPVEEKQQMLYEFNDTETDYPHDQAIHHLFTQQAEQTPNRIALIGSEAKRGLASLSKSKTISITYRELNQISDQLGHLLKGKGVKSDTIVAVMMERSLEVVFGILGILKAGGAYLPIIPDYPENRINYILDDSQAEILVTTRDLIHSEKVSRWAGEAMSINGVSLSRDGCSLSPITPLPSRLAYIIYTSGSTGLPKGVVVNHTSAVNVLSALDKRYPFLGSDVYLFKTSYIFDVSVAELFGWYREGGGLTILEKGDEKDPQSILNSIERDGVSHINFVPSMFNVFLEQVTEKNKHRLASLKYIFLAGEALLPQQVEKFRALNLPTRLENLYGPTEAAVYSSTYSLSQWEGTGDVPIGKPLANTRLYIMNKYNHLQSLGVGGELFIYGLGLARGYLNQPELTFERFINYQYMPEGHLLLRTKGKERRTQFYKTGDLARWMPDGNIEFLGRIDHQVKIRGFRIELGEIEQRLLQYPGIKEVVVIAREDRSGEKYLCAYIASERDIRIPGIHEHLSGKLPHYMIPSYFVQLDKIPLTTAGKVDRRSLPEPAIKKGENYIAPRDEVERKLAEIWAAVLQIDKGLIGVETNFFHLGGHSIKAITLVSEIHKEFNVNVPLEEIFKSPVIKKVAKYITEAKNEIYVSIKAVEKKEYYELSSAQTRLYILQQMDEGGTAYNIPSTMVLEGTVDKNKLQDVFKMLIKRHESLKTSFRMRERKPVQRIHENIEFSIEYNDFTGSGKQLAADREEIMKDFVKAFDLAKAPLLRVRLIKADENNHILLVDMHHIILDGDSTNIFVRDFISLYKGDRLTPLKLRYKDFCQWQNRLLQSGKIKKQEKYWLDTFKDDIPVLNLPTDYPRPLIKKFAGGTIFKQISRPLKERMMQMAMAEKTTMYVVILAMFNLLLFKYTGDEDIMVGTPVIGKSHADLRNLIGVFVNMLAMRCQPNANKTFREFLMEVKEHTLKALENQDYQFDELVKKLNTRSHMNQNPLVDVVFDYKKMDSSSEDFEAVVLPHLTIKPEMMESNISKFDLLLNAYDTDNELRFKFTYRSQLFKKETIKKMSRHLENIIREVLQDPEKRIAQIEMLDQEEKEKLFGNIAPVAGPDSSENLDTIFDLNVYERMGTMEKKIDCLLIGHNEINTEEYEKKIRSMGIDSGAYRDFNLNFIWYDNKPYTPADIFNLFYCHGEGSMDLEKPLLISETFNAAIAYLGTWLNRRGLTFTYVNSFRDEKEALRKMLESENILTIAIITTLYVSVWPIIEIVDFIRRHNSTAKIIIGGPYVSTQVRVQDTAALEYLFRETVGADIYVNSAQGEATLVNVINALKNNLPLEQVKNIYYKTANSFSASAPGREKNSLSGNMVDWNLFSQNVDKYVNVRTSISCPFSCAFCGFPERAGKYQTASPAAIETELDGLDKIGTVESVYFIDDTFNVPVSRFKKILRMLIKKNYRFKWHSYFRCQFADRETVELMKESGCEGVFLGIESGNEAVLKNMNKSANLAGYREGISLLKEYGIVTYGNFIVGFPGETLETVQDTIKFIEESELDFYRAQLWYCEPITPVWKKRHKYKLKGKSFEWSHPSMNSRQACDQLEKIFMTVKKSVWTPQYNFDFDRIWHLKHRGFTLEQIKEFLQNFNEGIKEKLISGGSRDIGTNIVKQIKRICQNSPEVENLVNINVKRLDETLAEFDL